MVASTPQKLRTDAKKLRAEADVHETRAKEWEAKANKYSEDSFETGMKNVFLKSDRRELVKECHDLREKAEQALHNARASDIQASSASDFATADREKGRAEDFRRQAERLSREADQAEQTWRDKGVQIEVNEREAAKLQVQAETARRIQADEVKAAQDLDARAKTMEDAAYEIEHPQQKVSELDDIDASQQVAVADSIDTFSGEAGDVDAEASAVSADAADRLDDPSAPSDQGVAAMTLAPTIVDDEMLREPTAASAASAEDTDVAFVDANYDNAGDGGVATDFDTAPPLVTADDAEVIAQSDPSDEPPASSEPEVDPGDGVADATGDA